MTDWLSNSEIAFGLIIEGRKSLTEFRPEMFHEPYDRMIKKMKHGDWSLEELAKINFSAMRSASEAAHSLNGLGEADWATILERSYIQSDISSKLKTAYSALERGKDIDVPNLVQTLSRLTTNKGDLVRMSDIEAMEMPLIKCGIRAIDFWIGGVPKAGLVTILAPRKNGKTSLIAKMVAGFVHIHKNKTAAVFTNEMLEGQFKQRTLEVAPEITSEEMSRIILAHGLANVGEVANRAATIGSDLGIVFVDFADMLIQGQVDPAKMEEVYRTLAFLANQLIIPVVLLAQPSRGYKGGLPRPHHARWTGMAEALSWLFLALYNPQQDAYAEDYDDVKIIPGKSYIIGWFCRSATKNELPGAVRLKWDGPTGWESGKGIWTSLEKKPKHSASDDDEEDDEDWSKEYK